MFQTALGKAPKRYVSELDRKQKIHFLQQC